MALLVLGVGRIRESRADPASMMGCGNFTLAQSAKFDSQFQALNSAGVRMCRIGLYPAEYWNGTPVVSPTMDALVIKAHSYGVTPMVLFEYAGNYGTTTPLGPASKWQAIGQAYATRYRPGSTWLQSQGITGWGITLFEAFNEPDMPAWGVLPKNASDPLAAQFQGNYHDGLQGLAAGVHGVSSSLKVVPGGFGAANSYTDYSLAGYGPAIADLWNNGSLSGIDLHTYNDAQYAKLFAGTNTFCAFNLFKAVKQRCGITADLDYYCTEFNYKNPDNSGAAVDDDRTAKNLLTVIWTVLSAAKNNNVTPANKLAFLWSLFPVESVYTTTTTLTPYTPRTPAKTYQLVANLTSGMEIQSVAPFTTGETVLAGQGKKMWVWINAPGYTNHVGSTYTVSGLPVGTTKVELYGWDSYAAPRQSVTYSGQGNVTFSGLAQNETYMVLASGGSANATLIPAHIEAEDFDPGGEGTGWHDTTAGNIGGQYRNTDVDIQTCPDAGGGYNVGWIMAGEWLRYTIDVPAAGPYKVQMRLDASHTGRTMHLEYGAWGNSPSSTGTINIPSTGDAVTYTTVTLPTISLPAGLQVIKVVFDTDYLNVNWLDISSASGGTG